MSTESSTNIFYYDPDTIEHYNNLLHNTLDSFKLREAYHHLKQYGVGWQDISDVVNLFPHLSLDENYSLFCYISSEYHGTYGKVAAVPTNNTSEPLLTAEENRFGYRDIVLPEKAASPMEALYADGSPESYLEALYVNKFFSLIPRPYDKYQPYCLYSPASVLSNAWNHFISIEDWRPRLIQKANNSAPTLYSLWLYESPILGTLSYYASYISLVENNFYDHIDPLYSFINSRKINPPYPTCITERKRYKSGLHCCVSGEKGITIAKEKDGR